MRAIFNRLTYGFAAFSRLRYGLAVFGTAVIRPSGFLRDRNGNIIFARNGDALTPRL